jgi:hypothetical protein
MGCSRETQDIFYYLNKSNFPYNGNKRNWKKIWHLIRHFDEITYGDTFGPYICKIKGHKAYQPDKINEPTSWACYRCHKYIKWNPRKEKLIKLNKIK